MSGRGGNMRGRSRSESTIQNEMDAAYRAQLKTLVQRVASASSDVEPQVRVYADRICLREETIAVCLPYKVREADRGLWPEGQPRRRKDFDLGLPFERPRTPAQPLTVFAAEERHALEAILTMPHRGVKVHLWASGLDAQVLVRVDAGQGKVITLQPERSPFHAWTSHEPLAIDVELLNRALLALEDEDAPTAPVRVFKAYGQGAYVLETADGWAVVAALKWVP